jgi:HEAT repeats
MIRSLALDEIGMSGDPAAIPWLVHLAEADKGADGPFLRLKAIEALGRLRAREAVPALRRIVEAKQAWRWMYPSELRIVAMQVLAKIDPDWLQAFVPRSGLEAAYLSFPALDRDPDASGIRQRRYPRLRLVNPVSAATTNLKQNNRLEIQSLNLGGGIATVDRHLPSGTMLTLRINPRFRSIQAQVFVRDARERTMAFEIAEISMEDRSRLRRLLGELGGGPPSGSPKSRVRRQRPVKTN